jgi:hypothetical protein
MAGRGGKPTRGRKFKPQRGGGHSYSQRDFEGGGAPDADRFVTGRKPPARAAGTGSSGSGSESESSGSEEEVKHRDSRKQAVGQPAFNGVVW